MTFKPVDTAIVMVVGPCLDDTDSKTLEEAIAYDAAGMDVSLIVEKTDGTTAVTAITLTTGGTSDWTHIDGGYYSVEVTAAQNAEEGIAYLRGVCDGVLPFESPRYNVVKANVYDSLVKGTDVLQTDVTQLKGDAQSITDFKDLVDTGYNPTYHTLRSDIRAVNANTISAQYLFDLINNGYNHTTHKVQGVVLVDTVTTNSDMRGTDNANTVVPDAAGVAPTAVEIRTEMDTNSTKMAPSQTLADYKATGFSVPNEYDTAIAALQTDLDNPAQYKADISALATSAGLATHDGKLDTADSLIDTLISRLTATRAGYLDNLSAGAVALDSGVDVTHIHGSALTETIDGYLAAAFTKLFDVATPLLVSSDSMRGTDSAALATALATAQADLDNPSQYMADISAVAIEANVQTNAAAALTSYDSPTRAEATSDKDAIITQVNANETKIDTVKVDTSAILVDTGTTLTNQITALNDITVADIIAGIADGTNDLQEMMRIMFAALSGKTSGGGTATLIFRDSADTKDRITATVDLNGNRTAVIVDGS